MIEHDRKLSKNATSVALQLDVLIASSRIWIAEGNPKANYPSRNSASNWIWPWHGHATPDIWNTSSSCDFSLPRWI